MKLHPDDEIVVTMSEADFNLLREIWMDAYYKSKSTKQSERIRKFITRVCSTAETLTLNWLDRKLEEFP